MKKLLTFLTCLLVSCSSASATDGGVNIHLPALDSYAFYVNTATDAQFQAAVQNAATQWREFTGVHIDVYSGTHACVVGCFDIIEPAKDVLNAATLEQGFVGYTIPGLIAVAGGMSWDETQETMTHEMGHALGLVHHNTNAVMNPAYSNAAKHVTCDDVSQYFNLRSKPVPSTVTKCTNVSGELDAGTESGTDSGFDASETNAD